MNYYSKSLPHLSLVATEKRKSPRKLLTRRVNIGVAEQSTIQGYTIDISVGGLSVLIPNVLEIGEQCAVRFDLLIEGQPIRVAGVGKITNCTCSGLDGFRVGMQFKAQDHSVEQLLTRFAA